MNDFDKLIENSEAGLNMPASEISENLQRTIEWFNARKGKFTGSKIKDLMGCTKSTAKLEWGRPEKLIDFSETCKKYIFSKAMERLRDKVIQSQTSKAMNYGTKNEDIVFELLKQKYPNYTFEKTDFIEFIDGVAGASPDGKILTDTNKKLGLEIKCATDWGGVYDRHIEAIDQSHQDFWQLQSEMLALGVDEIMYVVAEPSENILEPNITDLSIKFVKASPIHQQAIKQRCLIGNEIINKYLNGIEWHIAVNNVLTNFNLNENEN